MTPQDVLACLNSSGQDVGCREKASSGQDSRKVAKPDERRCRQVKEPGKGRAVREWHRWPRYYRLRKQETVSVLNRTF